jgi:membrane protease YdiL (CAAX protease family)
MAAFDLKRLFVGPMGVRSGWRLLLFVVVFVALTVLFSPLALLARLAPSAEVGALLAQAVITLVAALGAGWILLRTLDRRPFGALGFAWTGRVPRELGIGVAVGVGSLGAVVLAFVLAGWVSYHPEGGSVGSFLGALASGFLFFLVAAAAEEAFFRGYPFQVLVQGIGAVPATLVASLAFAAAHRFNPNVALLALINIFLAGVLLSAAYLRTRSLWFATAVHVGWNWAMASLLDLPVSGLASFNTPLYEPIGGGPAWVTGGAFGPEGGIGGSVAILLALAAVLWLPGLGEPAKLQALRPLVDDRNRSRWTR